jgi:hypothetical protein
MEHGDIMGLAFSARRDGVEVFSDDERRKNSLGISWATFSCIEDTLELTHTSTGWDYDGENFAEVILDIEAVRDACAAYLDTTQSKPEEKYYNFISVFHDMARKGIERGANAIYGL